MDLVPDDDLCISLVESVLLSEYKNRIARIASEGCDDKYEYNQKRKAVAVHAGSYNTAAMSLLQETISIIHLQQLRGISLTLDAATPLPVQPVATGCIP